MVKYCQWSGCLRRRVARIENVVSNCRARSTSEGLSAVDSTTTRHVVPKVLKLREGKNVVKYGHRNGCLRREENTVDLSVHTEPK